jgi:hypothetical protein
MQSGTRNPDLAGAAEVPVLLHLTWTARLAAVWAAAGGTAGGALIAVLILAGRMHPAGSVAAALLLSITGAALGLVHGAVIGRLGHRDEPATGLAAFVPAAFVAVLALLTSASLAVWLTTSAVLARAGQFWGWMALLAGGVAAAGVAVLATWLGWSALESAWTEWRERRLGAPLVGGTFTVLAVSLLFLEPALPGGRGTLTTAGWLLVAALATLWIATPVVVLGLRARHTHDS